MKVPVATVALSPEALGWAEAPAMQRRREARPPALLLPAASERHSFGRFHFGVSGTDTACIL